MVDIKGVERYLDIIRNNKPKAIIITFFIIILFFIVSFFGLGYLPELGRLYAKNMNIGILLFILIILSLALMFYGGYLLYKQILKSLPKKAIDMLRVIAATEHPFGKNRSKDNFDIIDEVALSETFGMSQQQTKRLLELLEKANCLDFDKGVGIYGISNEGRELLNKKERLP